MLTKIFLNKIAQHSLLLFALISLSGCLHQPVQVNTNVASITDSTVIAEETGFGLPDRRGRRYGNHCVGRARGFTRRNGTRDRRDHRTAHR